MGPKISVLDSERLAKGTAFAIEPILILKGAACVSRESKGYSEIAAGPHARRHGNKDLVSLQANYIGCPIKKI
jgi:hypothetical protein